MPSSSRLQSKIHAFITNADAHTGGGRGLGLCMAEGLVEAGGRVHCLDQLPKAPEPFKEAQARLKGNHNAGLVYHNVNVADEGAMRKCIADIAAENQRLDGLIAGKRLLRVMKATY